MRILLFFFIGGVLFPWLLNSQIKVTEKQNTERLLEKSVLYNREFLREKEIATKWARENEIPLRILLPDGKLLELQYLDEQMIPVYYETKNTGAAFTTSTNEIQPGGRAQLFLTGKEMFAGIWDGGRVEPDHSELNSRIILKDAGVESNHATHVAGTIIAKGINKNAMGMATDAILHSYDWNNDLSEIAAAAANGMLISNHSYGISLGWGWSDGQWKWYGHADSTYDYRFGYYSNKSRSLDEIAYNAPYYLMVWAAGNDRNDIGDGSRPPDGPYDCIGPEAIAKNVLAVGAVRKLTQRYDSPLSVQISDFSSWGPADDGRIKPDIVGAGVSLYSSISNNSYASYSGTSMAAPNITGSLLLLQELYENFNETGSFMRSATLKGLAIHTAYEAGNYPGPDYQFGWGLLNAEKAARLIIFHDNTYFFIEEKNLQNGVVYVLDFEISGSEDIVATLSWTDSEATPVSAPLSTSSLMLVNDLDMRIYNEDGSLTYYPWILSPLTPWSPATKGDNFRDNIEKIEISNPPAGKYKLEITHKGILKNGFQPFSLILQTRDIPGKTYYWIGNEGNWSDPNNWSLSSGGSSAGKIPTIHDHVFFDEKSFVGPLSELANVNLTENVACFSINWMSRKKTKIISNGNTITVYGSIKVDQENQLTSSPLDYIMVGGLPESIIAIEGHGFSESRIIFNGKGSWSAKKDLDVNSIHVLNGNFNAKGINIITKEIHVGDSDNINIDISFSRIDSLQSLVFLDPGVGFISDFSNINFRDNYPSGNNILSASNILFWAISHKNGNLSVNGSNSYRFFNAGGRTSFNSSNTFDYLNILPGTELIMKENSIQLVNLMLNIDSNSDSIVILRSDGDHIATIEFNKEVKLCFDFLDINRVAAKGIAIFAAGANSTKDSESTGWVLKDCGDILLIDFEYKFACTNSFTQFYDKSSGNITNWLWEFDKNGSVETSELKDPQTIYAEIGYYPVSLSITGVYESKTLTKEIYVMENMLVPGEIIVDGTRYISKTQAASYQWYLDDEPIAGAIQRTYDNVENVQGVYRVLISNGICNIMSQAIVTYSPIVTSNQPGFVLYPNPAGSEIFLDLKLNPDSNKRIEVKITDLLGRTLINKNYEPGGGLIRMNTQNLTSGMYLITIRFGNVIHTERLLIQ